MSDLLRNLLAAARLPASEPETAAYQTAYAAQRAAADALYEVPAARYAEPALRFRAGARISQWASNPPRHRSREHVVGVAPGIRLLLSTAEWVDGEIGHVPTVNCEADFYLKRPNPQLEPSPRVWHAPGAVHMSRKATSPIRVRPLPRPEQSARLQKNILS